MKKDPFVGKLDADGLPEMPELDFSRCRVVRRGPRRDAPRMTLSMLRESQGITQQQLAKRAGISQGSVSRAEAREDCRVTTLVDYAKALDGKLEVSVVINGRTYPITLSK